MPSLTTKSRSKWLSVYNRKRRANKATMNDEQAERKAYSDTRKELGYTVTKAVRYNKRVSRNRPQPRSSQAKYDPLKGAEFK